MTAPRTREEYEIRFNANTYADGEGMELSLHVPCPFCAAPDFVVGKLLELEMLVKLEQVCQECGRGVRLQLKDIVLRGGQRGVSYEFLQTQGDDPPPWVPPMRRLETPKGGDA